MKDVGGTSTTTHPLICPPEGFASGGRELPVHSQTRTADRFVPPPSPALGGSFHAWSLLEPAVMD